MRKNLKVLLLHCSEIRDPVLGNDHLTCSMKNVLNKSTDLECLKINCDKSCNNVEFDPNGDYTLSGFIGAVQSGKIEFNEYDCLLLDLWKLHGVLKHINHDNIHIMVSDDYCDLYRQIIFSSAKRIKRIKAIYLYLFFYFLIKLKLAKYNLHSVSYHASLTLKSKVGKPVNFFPISLPTNLNFNSKNMLSENEKVRILLWENFNHKEILDESILFLNNVFLNVEEKYRRHCELVIIGACEEPLELNEKLSKINYTYCRYVQDIDDLLNDCHIIFFPHSCVAGMHYKLLLAISRGLIPFAHSNQYKWLDCTVPPFFFAYEEEKFKNLSSVLKTLILKPHERLQTRDMISSFLTDYLSEERQCNRLTQNIERPNA